MRTTRSQVYLSTQAEVRQSRSEPTELLRVVAVAQAAALRLARAGKITDEQSALALLLCERYLAAAT